MKLSPFQIKILNTIKENYFYDFYWFKNNHCDLTTGIFQNNWLDFKHGEEVTIPNDNETLLLQIAEFINLWELLKNENLILEIPRSQHREKESFILRNSGDGKATSWDYFRFLTKDYIDKSFFPLPELEKFKRKRYKTRGERELNITRLISWVAIIISFLSLVVNFGYSYYSRNQPTKIKIVNTKQLTDSLNVKINNLDNLKSVVDTTMIISDYKNYMPNSKQKTYKTKKNSKYD